MTIEELSHNLRKEAISKGHSLQTVVSGYSMFPFLRNGDLLTVEPVPMETIKQGDVVVFEVKEKWIAHRVIEIKKWRGSIILTLKGDTNVEPDPPVTIHNYIGKIVALQRMNKNVSLTTSFRLIQRKMVLFQPRIYRLLMLYILKLFNPIHRI
jgi:signal peptidase I